MAIDFKPKRLQTLLESACCALPRVARQHDAAYVQAKATEGVDQAQNVLVVCNAKVATYLVFFNIRRVDGDDDLRLCRKLQQHTDLTVGRKSGQSARGVIVIKQLAAEFKIELAAEFLDALVNVSGLGADILLVVKTDFKHRTPLAALRKITAAS